MIPAEKISKKVPQAHLQIITVKVFYQLKAISFGLCLQYSQPMKAFNLQNVTVASLLLKRYRTKQSLLQR